MKKTFILLNLLIISILEIQAQFQQLGDKLVGVGGYGQSAQGSAVSLSADGKTVLVGGNLDNLSRGAVWVYTFTGNNFEQLSYKLVGSGASDPAKQGSSVSLSADGKTALIGAPDDNSSIGAAWIFTFDGNNFVQAGNKLVGTGAVGASLQGSSVKLSANGKTAFIGAPGDNNNQGAIWVFTFNGTNFVQYGTKIITTDAAYSPYFGFSISASDDGKTILAGGPTENSLTGTAWVYTFNGSSYSQLGSKLINYYATEELRFGNSVCLSGDGKTAMIRSPYAAIDAILMYTFNGSSFISVGNKLSCGVSGTPDNGNSVSLSYDGKIAVAGGGYSSGNTATWIFTFNGTTFVQSGTTFSGTGAAGNVNYGSATFISSDGKTIICGGAGDAAYNGAAWIFTDTINLCSSVHLNPNFSTSISKDTLYLTATGSSAISSYQWKISDNSVGSASSQKYALSTQQINLDSLHIKLIVSNMYGCADSISKVKSISQILDVKAAQIETEIFKINPNPFSSHLYIQTAIPGTFTVYNSMGQIIYKKSVSFNEYIELGALPQGGYHYQFFTDRSMKTGKLLKE